MSNRCSHGTLPHFSPQSSRLNACYYHQDPHWGPLDPGSPPGASSRAPRPPTHRAVKLLGADGRVWAARSSAIHFRGWSIRQVSCYTLLSGFRLPWPPSCCLYGPTPFLGSAWARAPALQPGVRFIPHRQSCLPRMAHWEPCIRFATGQWNGSSARRILPI